MSTNRAPQKWNVDQMEHIMSYNGEGVVEIYIGIQSDGLMGIQLKAPRISKLDPVMDWDLGFRGLGFCGFWSPEP